MKKKITILILAVVAIAIAITFMVIRHNEAEAVRVEEERWNRFIKLEFTISAMRFWPTVTTSSFTEILLVHNEAEAEALDLPDYVRVLWPTDHTLAILMEMNIIIIENEIDLSEFGLTYPITIDDLIYDWELVSNLYGMGFSNNDRSRILDYIPTHLRTIREETAREEEGNED